MSFSPSPGVRITLARSCQRRSAKKPPSEIVSERTEPGWSQAQRSPTSTPQSWVTSATGTQLQLPHEPLERLHVVLPAAGRVRRRVAEAGQVGGDPARRRRAASASRAERHM